MQEISRSTDSVGSESKTQDRRGGRWSSAVHLQSTERAHQLHSCARKRSKSCRHASSGRLTHLLWFSYCISFDTIPCVVDTRQCPIYMAFISLTGSAAMMRSPNMARCEKQCSRWYYRVAALSLVAYGGRVHNEWWRRRKVLLNWL